LNSCNLDVWRDIDFSSFGVTVNALAASRHTAAQEQANQYTESRLHSSELSAGASTGGAVPPEVVPG
jgi:hypothetical protein